MNLKSLKNRWLFRLKFHYGNFLSKIYFKKNSKSSNNFIILHQGRCGSTLLEKLLKNNPNINNFSEIYSNSYIPMESNLEKIIDYLSKTSSSNLNLFEIKYGIENHLSFSLNQQFRDFLKKEKAKIILLIRKNSIAQAKSSVYGNFTNQNFHFTEQDIFKKKKIIRVKSPFLLCGKFYTSINELADYIEKQTFLLKRYLDNININYEIIYYEELVSDKKSLKNKISQILENKNIEIAEKVKTIKSPINYDDLLFID